MSKIEELIGEVAAARERFIACVAGFTGEQASFKPSPEVWSATENAEHLVHAEDGGLGGMWQALEELRDHRNSFLAPHANAGLSIEEVVARTWKDKEQAPEVAAPRRGGAIAYWIASLQARQAVLEAFGAALEEDELEQVVYPHPISGPLDARQRLEFLRFHLERHRQQVERLKQHPNFPRGG